MYSGGTACARSTLKLVVWISLILGSGLAGEPVEFVIARQQQTATVRLNYHGKPFLSSPEQGLWTIGEGWEHGWPARWLHAQITSEEQVGEWIVVRGQLSTAQGQWELEDAYRLEGSTLHGRRRWTWTGSQPARQVTLTVRFQARGPSVAVLLPGILYYGNPAGARSGRVPVFRSQPGELAFFEEHRYPLPFAYAELSAAGEHFGVSLHTVPAPVPFGNRADQWWSLGVQRLPEGIELALLSGPCAMNGHTSVIKGARRQLVPYDETFLNVPPGAVIEKEFYLNTFPVERKGFGFTQAVEFELQRWGPFVPEQFPPIEDTLRAKYRAAKSRFIRQTTASGFSLFPVTVAGFRKYPPRAQRQAIVLGWTGQAAAPAYALLALEDWLRDPEIPQMVRESLDFLITSPVNERGFHVWYDLTKQTWEGQDFVSQGQGLYNLVRAIEQAERRGWDTSRWKAFVRQVAEVHARRILNPQWQPADSSEMTFVAPLFRCARLFGEAAFAEAAKKVALQLGERHAGTYEPYWGGTLDARCEDKEAAAAALQAFLALWEETRNPEHLRWAEHAAYMVLTYTYLWNVDLPPGRLRDHAVRTQGWTLVSPQNQHLDVWGTIIAPDLYRLGQLRQRRDWMDLALVMYRTCGQLVDPWGSQGEQLNHTNWLPDWKPELQTLGRGTYNETWTPFWITAHFLTGAAELRALGLKLRE